MAENKTQETKESVKLFLDKITDKQKIKDCKDIVKMMETLSGSKAKMWGTAIIGFGKCRYKSEATGREGDWFHVGFSPRKANLTLYLMGGLAEKKDDLKKLGKHKISGGSCLYINKLDDVDTTVLKKLIKESVVYTKKKWGKTTK